MFKKLSSSAGMATACPLSALVPIKSPWKQKCLSFRPTASAAVRAAVPSANHRASGEGKRWRGGRTEMLREGDVAHSPRATGTNSCWWLQISPAWFTLIYKNGKHCFSFLFFLFLQKQLVSICKQQMWLCKAATNDHFHQWFILLFRVYFTRKFSLRYKIFSSRETWSRCQKMYAWKEFIYNEQFLK